MTRSDGFPIWVSDVEPGSVHDLTVAREHALGALYPTASRDLPTLATKARVKACTPRPNTRQQLDVGTRTCTMLRRSLRAQGERGFALLSQCWRVLRTATACPTKIGLTVKTALMLTQFQHRYLTC